MQRTKTRPTILVVEDYADSRQMLKLLFEDLDYCVFTAANGRDALTIAADNQVDLILIDFDLPDMTGPTVVRHIRQLRDQLRRVPIIMLTAFDGYEYRQLADEAGCNAFVVKPPDFEALNRIVDGLLQEAEVLQKRQSRRCESERQPLSKVQNPSFAGSTNVKVEPWPTSL